MKELTENDVIFSVECLPEHAPVRGNAMASGDEDYDREVEDKILEELEKGNNWAWCTVKVTARHKDIPEIRGTDYLVCCSYESQKDFCEDGGYYADMKARALEELQESLEYSLERLQKAIGE